MATVPDSSYDDKKRQRRRNTPSLQRDIERYREGGLLGAGGVVRGVAGDLGTEAQQAFQGYQRNVAAPLDQALFGAGGQRTAAAPAAPPPAPFAGVRGTARPTRAPLDRGSGLTRIVQTAPGVFTDAAGAQGEERYYDAVGNRADTNFAGPAPGQTVGGPAEWARREQAAAVDLNTDAGYNQVLGQGRRSLERVNEMGADVSRRANLDFMTNLAPEDRAKLEAELAKSGATDARSRRDAEARIKSAEIAAGGTRANAAIRAEESARGADVYERELLRENPAAAVREILGGMENLSPQERIAALSDPNNPAGARVRGAVRQALAQQVGDPQITPAQTRRSGGLQRFLENPLTGLWTGGQFATDDDLFTDTFDPSQFGLTDAEWEAMIAADATVNNRNRR